MRESSSKNQLPKKTRWDILLFYAFLLISPLSLRKIIASFKIDSSFNEYTGVYIYLSDLVLISIFIILILCNINIILSMSINILTKIRPASTSIKLFHVEQNAKKISLITFLNIVPRGTFKIIKETYTHIINNFVIIFPLFMGFFSLISIMWTTNKTIALFRSLKLVEFLFLYFYIIKIVPRGTIKFTIPNIETSFITFKLFHVEQFKNKKNKYQLFKKEMIRIFCSTWNKISKIIIVPRGTIIEVSLKLFVGVMLFQSIIGISQFLIQKSLGLFWLKESIISPTLPGVAKIIFSNQPFIRAYGLFPHPNILGGYLVVSIISTLLLRKLFHVEQFKQSLFKIILLVQIVALILTFSKSAIIGLLIAIIYIFFQSHREIVPRGTSSKGIKKLFHVEQLAKKIILILSILVTLTILVKPDINSILIKTLKEREFYINVSRGTFIHHPILGVGAGQFIFQLANISNIQAWQLQPVHNVFLLILNEYGIFIAIGFIILLFQVFKQDHCSTWNNLKNKTIATYLKGTLLAFIFIMLFDHYFWDIQQGIAIFWILLGFIVRTKLQQKENCGI